MTGLKKIKNSGLKSLLIGSIALVVIMSACNHPGRHASGNNRVLIQEDSLPESKRQILDSLKRELFSKVYSCLAESGYTYNCDDNDAGGVTLVFIVDIDTSGALAHCEIVGEDICGADRQKTHDINKCILKSMTTLIYPAPLRDMKLKFIMSRYVRS
ncbi:MAG: hypothetical protein JWO03_482 [Bacteroidetes bacterium]|nr:hypothetical protein [Bacteroidota bacterium]